MDLVDFVEQVLGRICGEYVGQARVHAHANQRQPACGLPVGVALELLIAQLRAVRPRQAHRHVHVVGAGGECAVHDRQDELRVDRVHHEVDLVALSQSRHDSRRRGVDLRRAEALGLADLAGDGLRSTEVVVGQHHVFQPRPAVSGDFGDGLAYRANAN